MSKVNKKILGNVLTVIILALFAWYFTQNIQDFKILLDINILHVILLFVIGLLMIVANSVFMKVCLSLFGRKIDIHESIRVTLISTAGNFFAPAGSGLGFRAVYLKKRHKLPYSDYISITLCNYVIVFMISAMLGLVGLWAAQGGVPTSSAYPLYVFFAGLLTISTVLLFVRFRERETVDTEGGAIARVKQVLVRMSKGWTVVLSNKKVLVGLIGIVVANAVLSVVQAYIVLESVGITISFGGLILYGILGALSLFINITPGNLGVKESVYVVFSGVIGLSTAQILSAAVVERVVTFVMIAALWLRYGNVFKKQQVREVTGS